MLIGLTGAAGSGKDTVGGILQKLYGFETYAFAGPLKAGMAAMGFPEPSDRTQKEVPIPGHKFTWREAAQKLGTEWGRSLDPDLWMNMGKLRFLTLLDQTLEIPHFVITDVRFENEASMVRELGGRVWHIKGRKADLGASAAHASEYPVKQIWGDAQITNDGSLEQLEELVKVTLGGKFQ